MAPTTKYQRETTERPRRASDGRRRTGPEKTKMMVRQCHSPDPMARDATAAEVVERKLDARDAATDGGEAATDGGRPPVDNHREDT